MRELIYKDEAYKAIDNCIRDSWYRISPTEAKMNIHHLISDANRLQGEWTDIYQLSIDGHMSAQCKNCGEKIVFRDKVPNFCSNCGAKMKGV